MELREALERRRMVRSFDGRAVDDEHLRGLCVEALRAPTAGNSAGVRLNIVEHHALGDYFAVATDEAWRRGAPRAAGLQRCGAAVLVTSRPDDYVARYRERDKNDPRLTTRDGWPLPYWHTDAAMATMALLLLIEEANWGAALWGSFRHAPDVLAWAGLNGEELFATVLVGYPDGQDRPSSSLARATPPRGARVRRLPLA